MLQIAQSKYLFALFRFGLIEAYVGQKSKNKNLCELGIETSIFPVGSQRTAKDFKLRRNVNSVKNGYY